MRGTWVLIRVQKNSQKQIFAFSSLFAQLRSCSFFSTLFLHHLQHYQPFYHTLVLLRQTYTIEESSIVTFKRITQQVKYIHDLLQVLFLKAPSSSTIFQGILLRFPENQIQLLHVFKPRCRVKFRKKECELDENHLRMIPKIGNASTNIEKIGAWTK